MGRRQQLIFAGVVMILAIPACQSIANPVRDPESETTQIAEIIPADPHLTPTSVIEGPKIPPNFLADPNTVCTLHGYHALSCLDGDGWHIYEMDAFDPPYIPGAIARCSDGRTYLSQGNEVYLLEGEMLIGLGDAYGAETIACGNGNEIWTGDMFGVSHFDGAAWTRYTATEIFGSSGPEGTESVYSMAVAPNGDLWVTTDKNIATFDGSGWKVVTPSGNNSFLTTYDLERGLAVDANGNVWAVTSPNIEVSESQLLKYDGIEWSTYSGPGNEIRFIAVDIENRVWAAADGNQVYTFDPQTNSWMLQFGTRQFGTGHSSYALYALQFDRQDRLWVATDYGLDIYDGSAWTSYHTHTADLYANKIDEILVFGDGPQLPALMVKAPGAVRGKLVNVGSTAYSDVQAEICLKPVTWQLSTDTPCADQAYHALTTVDPDGNFLFTDIPAGKYYLMIRESDIWKNVVEPDISSAPNPNFFEFEVKPGVETQLGEIET